MRDERFLKIVKMVKKRKLVKGKLVWYMKRKP